MPSDETSATSFSQRYGYKPAQPVFQREVLLGETRNRLWNVLELSLWSIVRQPSRAYASFKQSDLYPLFQTYWDEIFRRPLSSIPRQSEEAITILFDYWMACDFNELLDVMEVTVKNTGGWGATIKDLFNQTLKEENTAYQFVDLCIVEVTSEQEISEIEESLRQSGKFAAGAEHIKRALELLADRDKKDYRNSIKESISAVEAIAKSITGLPKATLGDAVKVLENNRVLHQAYGGALSKLYGWTNDDAGIRHAMMEKPDLSIDDARFMLIICSAFVNYLIASTND